MTDQDGTSEPATPGGRPTTDGGAPEGAGDPAASTSGDVQAGDNALLPGQWVCPACRSVNDPDRDRCQWCGIARAVRFGGTGADRATVTDSSRFLPVDPSPAGQFGSTGQPHQLGPPPPPTARPSRGGSPFVALGIGLLAVALAASAFLGYQLSRPPAATPSGQATESPGATPADSGGTTPVSPSTATGSASPSPALHVVGDVVDVAGLQTHEVVRVETWPGAVPPHVGESYLAVEVRVVAPAGEPSKFDQVFYSAGNDAGQQRRSLAGGRQPVLGYGNLEAGDTAEGWLTFLVTDPGPFVLTYRFPLGQNGQAASIAVRLEPVLPPTPEPTPEPTPRPPSGGSPGSNFGFPTAVASLNYAGYGAQRPGSSVTSIVGSWVQPAVTCSGTSDSEMAVWVGIDDGGSHFLEQTGTAAECRAGSRQATYFGWYEMFPAALVAVMPIRAGDHFSASVTKSGVSWTLDLRDLSSGAHNRAVKRRDAPAIQALWVVEAPARGTDTGFEILPLAKFGPVSMTGNSAVVGGVRRDINDTHWGHYRFDMQTDAGAAKTRTSAPAGGGTTFTVSWRHR